MSVHDLTAIVNDPFPPLVQIPDLYGTVRGGRGQPSAVPIILNIGLAAHSPFAADVVRHGQHRSLGIRVSGKSVPQPGG